MFAMHRFHLSIMGLAAGLCLLIMAPVKDAAGYDLLTAEEIASRTAPSSTRSITPLKNEGPEVIIHNPDGANDLRSPLDFDVEFRERTAAPDMATLKLEYDLGLFWTDVTSRLAGHAEITDSRIISRGAELPSGRHVLRLSISDLAGKVTATKITFTVAEP